MKSTRKINTRKKKKNQPVPFIDFIIGKGKSYVFLVFFVFTKIIMWLCAVEER